MPTIDRTIPPSSVPLVLRHLGCALLVLAFVNLFKLYRFVGDLLGARFLALAPLVLPPLFLMVIFIFARRSTRHVPLSLTPILLGISLCLVALAIPDPEIAIKRIHVAQYLLLSLAVRLTLATRLSGIELTLSATLLSCLYGVHDEMLQGLHPDRTYGLRDIMVNTLASCGGGLIWHGFSLCEKGRTSTGPLLGWSWRQCLMLFGMSVGVVLMVVPLIAYRNHPLPPWPFLPLAALLIIWGLFFISPRQNGYHLFQPLGVVALLFLLYPFAVNVLQIPFY
jgi:VanZ family protein